MEDSRLYRSVGVPRSARLGPRAIRELADDALWLGMEQVAIVWSAGLPAEIAHRVRQVMKAARLPVVAEGEVVAGSLAEVDRLEDRWTGGSRGGAGSVGGVIAVGGGRALDVGKALAARLQAQVAEGGELGVPVVCVPTSLSHDGFASPSSSLVDATGRRVSVRSPGPAGVTVDTTVVASAPAELTLAGVGDVMAKVTALADWRLAEHAGMGERVDGVAAAVAQSAIAELLGASIGRDAIDEAAAERLARALLLGGVAMAAAGSSRPCSGSEHLISHALDRLRTPAGSHGLQVGLAAWVVATLQGEGQADFLRGYFDRVGFWDAIRREVRQGLTPERLCEAVRLAPSIREGYVTVLSRPGAVEQAVEVIERANWLWES